MSSDYIKHTCDEDQLTFGSIHNFMTSVYSKFEEEQFGKYVQKNFNLTLRTSLL